MATQAYFGDTATESPGPVRGATVDYVLGNLREGVLRGVYAPGQRLIEADLTREFGVSRGPLREAFRRLSAEGLLEIVPNRGAIVRRLSLREMIEFFQIRMSLEVLAVRLAAEALQDPSARKRFEAEIEPIWAEGPRLADPTYLDENNAFHEAIVRASGNQQLLILTRQLQLPLIMFQLAMMLKPEIIAASVTEHRAIALAILGGRVQEAEDLVKAHLERASRVAEEMPARVFRV